MSLDNRFDMFLPDPHTYTIVINERMRALFHRALQVLVEEEIQGDVEPTEDYELAVCMRDMLDPNGSTGPLAISPAVNGLVL